MGLNTFKFSKIKFSANWWKTWCDWSPSKLVNKVQGSCFHRQTEVSLVRSKTASVVAAVGLSMTMHSCSKMITLNCTVFLVVNWWNSFWKSCLTVTARCFFELLPTVVFDLSPQIFGQFAAALSKKILNTNNGEQ